MRRGKVFQRFLAALLAFVMVLGYVPVTALAANSTAAKPQATTLTGNPFADASPSGYGNIRYRIPAMVTLNDGDLFAAADARWDYHYDGGGIDTVFARSDDNGATWEWDVANYMGDNVSNGVNVYGGQYSAFIDPALLHANVGSNEYVYMLVDLYPYGIALNGSGNTAPSTEVGFNAQGYLKLRANNASSYDYYLNGDTIYTNSGTPVSGYSVDEYFNIKGDGVDTNLFLEDSPYKVVRTGYLYLTKYDVATGKWSAPTLLNNIKTNQEQVCLVGPGRGLQASDGTLIFPVYSYNYGTEFSGFIYSTDEGATWQRVDTNLAVHSSEAQLVQLDDNTIRMFFRNKQTALCYVDITGNGTSGYTVSQNHKETKVDINSFTQLSVIQYSKTVDGKPLILVSCPAPDGGSVSSAQSERRGGMLYAFSLESDKSMTYLHAMPLTHETATFQYSCMTETKDGDVAILYEIDQTGMKFEVLPIENLIPSTSQIDEPGFVDESQKLVSRVVLRDGETKDLTFRGLGANQTLQLTTAANGAVANATLGADGKTLTLAAVAEGATSVTYTVSGVGDEVKDGAVFTVQIEVLGEYDRAPVERQNGDVYYRLYTGTVSDIPHAQFIIVHDDVNYALADQRGSTRGYPVTIDGNEITNVDGTVSETLFDFTKQNNGTFVIKSTIWLGLNNNSTLVGSAQECTLTSVGDYEFRIYGQNRYLLYTGNEQYRFGTTDSLDNATSFKLYQRIVSAAGYTPDTELLEQWMAEGIRLEAYKNEYTAESYNRLAEALAAADVVKKDDATYQTYSSASDAQNVQTDVNEATESVAWAISQLEPVYAVIVEESPYGTATANPSLAPVGRTVTINPVPNAGYEVASITATYEYKNPDGTVQNSGTVTVENGQFIMPKGVVTVTVTYRELDRHEVFVGKDVVDGEVVDRPIVNGTVTASSYNPLPGTTVTLTLTPDAEYTINGWKVVDAAGKEISAVSNGVNNQYVFTMPESDVYVTATFKEIERWYNVTVKNETETLGTVTPNMTQAQQGNIIEITINPAEDCYLSMLSVVTVHGSPVGLTKKDDGTNTYWFKMPKDDVVIASYFIEDDFISGLHLGKTAILQDDGTWTITLEAYATGNVTVQIKREVKPTDIILILDQSGSMDHSSYTITLNSGFVPAGAGVTNQNLVNGGYYYYDTNDKTYYEIEVTRNVISGENYWTYQRGSTALPNTETYPGFANAKQQSGDTYRLDNIHVTESIIDDSIRISNNTSFDTTADGYLKDNYLVFQRNTRTEGYWPNRVTYYSYEFRDDLSNYDASKIAAADLEDTAEGQNADNVRNGLTSRFTGSNYQDYHFTSQTATVSQTEYVVIYTAATNTNNEMYEYVYYYEDDAGELWEVGKSASGDTASSEANLTGIYKEQSGGTGRRITALRNAANLFLYNMNEAAIEQQVDHRIAVVGFAGNETTSSGGASNSDSQYYYQNSELFVGDKQYNYAVNGKNSTYNTSGNLAANHYSDAFQSVGQDAGYKNLLASIQNLEGAGATYPSVGFEMAKGLLEQNKEAYAKNERDAVVIFMTDGSPGWDANSFSNTQHELINGTDTTTGLAEELEKTYGAVIKTIALLSSAPAEGGNVDNFLSQSATNGEYTLATTGVDLENFFDDIEIGSSVSTETVTLSHNAYLVDRVSQYFNMPGNDLAKDASDADLLAYFQKYVKVGLAQHVGDEAFTNTQWLNYVSGENATGGVVIDSSKADEETLANIHIWPTWHDQDGKVHGVTAHSFDYTSAVNMVHTYNIAYNDANFNDVYDAPVGYVDLNASGICDSEEELATVDETKGGKINDGIAYLPGSDGYVNAEASGKRFDHLPMGNKVVIEISGVTAKDAAALNHYVYTNHDSSGLWDIQAGDDSYSMVAAFPMPVAMLVNRTYVLDYAKTAQLAAVKDVRSGLSLDSAKDGIFSGFKNNVGDTNYITALRTTDPDQPMKYGDIVLQTGADGYGKTFYTPKTMNWDGMDTFYVFWTDVTAWEGSFSDEVTGNGWTKINVIPANNIYYEDTFVSTETTDGGNATNTTQGTVGIVFSDDWTMDYSNEGDRDQNAEQPEDLETGTGSGIHGWVDELADDTGFSDGSAHVTNTAMATATFTFTGTGMDIYSRTNTDTGIIQVRVKPVADENGNKPNVKTSYYVVDNLAKSGDYYQIPTVAYTALDKSTGEVTYGTYEVKITVTNGAVDEGRMTFYLDGIRIYNPLGLGGENNPDVDNAYRDELKAVFTEVRDIILTNEDFNVEVPDPEFTVTFDANMPVDESLSANAKPSVSVTEDKLTTFDRKIVNMPTAAYSVEIIEETTEDDVSGDTEAEGSESEETTVVDHVEYVFNGWYTAAEGGEKVTTDTVFEKDTTVYAQWLTASEVTNQYTITFDYNFEGEPEALTATTVNGKLVYVPHVEREGYVLDGWYDAESEGTSVAVDGEFTQDVTVYAIWSENPNDVDGGNAENKANTAIEGAVFIDWIKDEQSPDESEEGYHTYTVGVMDVFEKYGPKNEVYLEKGQSIVFKVDTTLNNKYFVGLKSLDGKAVVAEISGVGKDADGNATDKVSASFSHTTDMYYEIIPTAEGYISIKNESESGAILAITKLRTTNPAVQARTGGIIPIEAQEATDFALKFAQMTAVTYNAAPEAPEGDTTEPEKPGDTPVEPELPDVEIENPEINPDPEPEEDKVAELIQEMAAKLKALVNKLFGSMRAWMNG